jgi:hypothetical protein
MSMLESMLVGHDTGALGNGSLELNNAELRKLSTEEEPLLYEQD